MSWNFGDKPRSGTETALDACDYFLDEVLEMSTFMGKKCESVDLIQDECHSYEESVHTSNYAREQIRLLKHKELRQAVISGDERTIRVLLEALGDEKELVVNMAPAGANTLLFLACQSGYEQITKLLLEAGADGRSHTVTRYSPLYAAVHHGNYNISKLLLDSFPELVQQMTVERWLVLHAACINGHVNLVELLISYEYPESLYNTYRDDDGCWEWRLPFDPNQQDVTGQTSLYIASILGNKALVHMLLNWKVKAHKISPSEPSSAPITPTRKRISFGIQAIMSKLNISGEGDSIVKQDDNTADKCPINLNLLCGAARETSLLAAVRGGFLDVVALLLQHGADPNIVARPVEDQNDPKCSEEIYGLCNVPIAEACKQKSTPMVDLLLKYGAKDEQGKALHIAVANGDEVIISRLLGKRVHPDSDYKINKKGLPTTIEKDVLNPSVSNVTYSTLFPNVPTIIDWHNTNVQLPFIRSSWIVSGVLQLNPKLQTHPRVNEVALMAITRIDLSHNSLTSLPPEIFSLISLKYLNVAQNVLEKLPRIKIDRSPGDKPGTDTYNYNCPVLEELYIQDNRLVAVPPEIFRLPSLLILDISNNKLQELPFEMWKAPKLRELNIAFNLLKDLPVPPMHANLGSLHSLKKSISAESTLSSDDVVCKLSKYPSRTVTPQQLVHRNIWSYCLEVTDNDMKWNETKQEEGVSQLSSLNVANNLFTSIPAALPCLAANLTRLNLSYNSLRSMGHVTSYPATLKQLDLSHNEITCWPSLPRITESDPYLRCYSQTEKNSSESGSCDEFSDKQFSKSSSNSSFRSTVLKSVCRHRKHLRLEALRTLILADNLLTRIQLSTDDVTTFNESDEPEWSLVGIAKSRLIFPNLSMLDISNNCLKEIPPSLHELSSLSVLNISGNVDITDLPPHLGLLSRLWNLNTRGCLLQDPLKSMIESKKYKTMDIIGYLKSIYEDAQPYTRMKLMVVGVHGIGKTTLLDLLRQGGNNKGRVSMDHWAKRMGHKNSYGKTSKGTNISTVGVDIGTWICDKKKKTTNSYGPVVFRTWDFGGQKEYYATHQYFLSKRSLYLVLWKITDGHKGLAEILQWLGNIQARAPNSPVIIVGTHFDSVGECFSAQKAEELQQIIREKFIAVPDAEKIGLPRVIDSIEISCRTLHNIRLLSNIIYDTAFMLRSPGSKEPLLLQRVPASYVALEDVVTSITSNLRSAGLDPVLDAETYKKLVTEQMKIHNHKGFRDWAELNQATMFLHDNGVILHYDDATLRDFYFLDPQWLCDMLAHVVTVREINPFARTGIMKLEDLQLLFKSTNTMSTNNRSYIVNLLNKFEVALTWDARTLLIPSLLPLNENNIQNGATVVRISQRTKYRGISLPSSMSVEEGLCAIPFELNSLEEKKAPIKRVLLMTYFPSGFWSRLITRVLADEQIIEAVKNVYKFPVDSAEGLEIRTFVEKEASWNLWQTGLALYVGNVLILKIWEVPFIGSSIYRNTSNKFKLKIDGLWNDINLCSSSILEITFPLSKVSVSRSLENGEKEILGESDVNFPTISQLLALTVDHIDLLLEDWYPSLGTRFVHTSEGRFLITRLVICPKCLQKLNESSSDGAHSYSKSLPKFPIGKKNSGDEDSNALSMFAAYLNAAKERKSEDSLNLSDADSGVGPDSTGSSRNTSVDGHPMFGNPDIFTLCYTWMIEECILSVYYQSKIFCPLHSEIDMLTVAPDVVFADIPEKYAISSESIMKGSLLGRGAFGFVFKATCKIQGTRSFKSVAMKMLQPVPPGARAKESAVLAYKIALGKWDRDPLQHSCKAYCTARQELAVLLTLKHPNIVPLVGICIKPLALVLELAPLGALDTILRQYRRSGARVGPHTFQIMVLQAARAIEYLHRKRIIYRDLKSENVLVWDFPSPHTDDSPKCNVHIKIADYGISRITAPSGSKGFGGTEGYMAPEIIRYNGEEEYTEKVDCFSFGMFLYEIITLRQPFEGQESIKECILEGHRPALTQRETHFPTYCLDLMVLCWDELPKKRPSASQVVSILSAPECIQLLDIISLSHGSSSMCGVFNQLNASEDDLANYELWLPCSNSRIDIIEASYYKWLHYRNIACENRHQLDQLKGAQAKATKISLLCCCVVEKSVWVGDSSGMLHVYRTCDYSHVFSYMLDTAVKSAVVCLIYLRNIKRVAVGLSCGRVFLVDSTNIPSNCAFAEGSFVLTELCSGELLYSACAVWNVNEYELWCGETSGIINVFPIKDSVVSGHLVLCHIEEPKTSDKLKVARMYSTSEFVFSCLNPGYTVYQWSVETKKIENKLDCSKLLPCSESLKSISIEEHFNPNKCQISAIAVHGNEIYIGTTWGCLIIGDASTLRPITVFRPYENEIKAIITPPNNNTALIATIGRRYRSLISRYTDIPHRQPVSRDKFSDKKFSTGRENYVHCLMWRAQNWT